MKPNFTESDACRSGRYCEKCRDPQAVLWRTELAKAWTLPGNDINFDCPHGKPWRGRKPKPVLFRILARAAHAAKSVAKTSVGIDRANDAVVEARLNVCRRCEHAVWKNNDVHTCGPMLESLKGQNLPSCGCVLKLKARDLKEACPVGKWPAVGRSAATAGGAEPLSNTPKPQLVPYQQQEPPHAHSG